MDELAGWLVETVMVLAGGAPVDEVRDEMDCETLHKQSADTQLGLCLYHTYDLLSKE